MAQVNSYYFFKYPLMRYSFVISLFFTISNFIFGQSLQTKEEVKTGLEFENSKNVQTIDIDHFWEAFDHLKNCKSLSDSIASFQKLYIDRATDGFIDFMATKEFSQDTLINISEQFVNKIAQYPKFYHSIRRNTYEAKKVAPTVEEIILKFKEIYPNFTPAKVCFAIGLTNSGGTVSDKFVLIGTEVTTSTKNVDLSEFNDDAFSKVLAYGGNIVQKIKNIVAHEFVHTQQKYSVNKSAIKCDLLYNVMQEGFCDFIGELVAGNHINTVAQEYGDKHERQLWTEFKNELCNESSNNWLYNYLTVKEKPADLGYYIGYKIAQEYYKNAVDKKQAVIDIIEMDNPIKFLELSKYDQKEKMKQN